MDNCSLDLATDVELEETELTIDDDDDTRPTVKMKLRPGRAVIIREKDERVVVALVPRGAGGGR